ncbi:MAG: BON domain-containing protein [Acidobacteriota bacterium]|nr:BON domain-containing protein [Acidobacteriota bacterium]
MSIFLLGASLSLAAPQEPAKPDNTKVNKRDRNAGQPTAGQQKENTSDRQLTAKIRRAIMADKSLSTYAHNVKIIVQNGEVTLKGPVHTEDEKKAVEAKATEAAGSAKVTNELSVKGDTTHAKKHKAT